MDKLFFPLRPTLYSFDSIGFLIIVNFQSIPAFSKLLSTDTYGSLSSTLNFEIVNYNLNVMLLTLLNVSYRRASSI